MFGERELKIQLGKTNRAANSASDQARRPRKSVEEIIHISRKNVKDVAILVGIGYTAKKVLDTASTVTIIAANAKLK